MRRAAIIIMIILSALFMSAAADDSGTISYVTYITTSGVDMSPHANLGVGYNKTIRVDNIQNYPQITLYQCFIYDDPSDDSFNPGNYPFTARLDNNNGAVIGTGSMSLFDNGVGGSGTYHYTLHAQFDTYSLPAGTTGTHQIYLAGTSGSGYFMQGTSNAPNNLGLGAQYDSTHQQYAHGIKSPTLFSTLGYYNDYWFTDKPGGLVEAGVDRDSTITTPSTAQIFSNGALVASEYKASGVTTAYCGLSPVVISVEFPDTSIHNVSYTWGEADTDTVSLAVNLYEKYSNAILINQAITVTPTAGGAGETKTSYYGETLHFGVTPGASYWFNASRTGYLDYNESYTIPASPGIYSVYMERILTPIANKSYAHFSVVDQTNGGLIPNAEIRLSDGQTKLTNSAGYAWFSVNNSEQINYYVSKPSGYWPAYGAMNLTADESILVALQRYTGPTATATMPGWTPVTVPTTGTGVNPVVTLSAQLRQQNVQEGMDVWYTNLPFISQFLFLLFIIGGLGLMAGGTRRN